MLGGDGGGGRGGWRGSGWGRVGWPGVCGWGHRAHVRQGGAGGVTGVRHLTRLAWKGSRENPLLS